MRDVILLDPAFRQLEVIFNPEDLARVQASGEVLWARNDPFPEADYDTLRERVTLIITGSWRHGDVRAWPKLRAILEVGGGFPSPADLDYAECFRRGIRVLSCAPAFGPAVAEMALGLALAGARQIAFTDRAFRTGEPNWSHTSFSTAIGEPFTLYGKTIGLIGMGGLAHSLLPLLAPFKPELIAYDPWLTDTYIAAQGAQSVALNDLMAHARVIFVLAVPSSSNQALLDRRRLESIRPDALLVLVSRSHVVDFDALTDLALAGRLRAAVDVFPQEPLPRDHPIRRAEGVVLSSHRAGAQGEALHSVGRLVAEDIEALTAGLVPRSMQHAQPEYIRLRG
ncbi:MAG: hydroxyacid dehydrogenase [Chloroflexi bacterium]|nr:hydroxyacid dehydrogenase [Chloroflexota bacterium]